MQAATNARGHDFTVPASPKSRKSKKLSALLRHAKSLPQSANSVNTVNAASNKMFSGLLAIATAVNALSNCHDIDDGHVVSFAASTAAATLNPTLNQKTIQSQPQADGEVQSINVFAAFAEIHARAAVVRKLFNPDTDDGCKRIFACQCWALIIAKGAMVEPPPSDIPEIIVPPDAKTSSIPLPKSYKEAVTGPYRRYWIEAVKSELENLRSREVWREEPLPKGSKPVPGRYVWKVKSTDTGLIAKWKARWIIQGFRQRAGHDFDKTFANVANVVTVRTVLATACEKG